jgi:hypothetical protein
MRTGDTNERSVTKKQSRNKNERPAKNPPADIIAGLNLAGFLNVGSLGALGALNNLKLDRISFLQSAIAVAGYCRIVDEDVGAIVPPDETVTFGIIEPLYRSSHRDSPPVVAIQIYRSNRPRLRAPIDASAQIEMSRSLAEKGSQSSEQR